MYKNSLLCVYTSGANEFIRCSADFHFSQFSSFPSQRSSKDENHSLPDPHTEELEK